jgi:hypothetical protein
MDKTQRALRRLRKESGSGMNDVPQGLKSLRDNSVLEGYGLSRDVSSLRDSPDKP